MRNLKKTIHKTLVETKENKKKTILENKIVTNRFKIILEDKNMFKKKNKEKLFSQLTSEVNYLKNQGFNNQMINEGLIDIIKSLFGNNSDVIFTTWKDQGVNWLIDKLGVSHDEELSDKIKSKFSNVLTSEIPELFTDCDKVTDMIVDAMIEVFQENLKNGQSNGSEASRILQYSVLEMTSHEDFQDSVEVKLKNTICPLLSKISSNMSNQENDIKSKIFPNMDNMIGINDISGLDNLG
jgi:hypothetical protein